MDDLNCWNCGESLDEIPRPISRHANCLLCHAELHACRQCRNFDAKRPTQCLDERSDPPTRKDIANFCEWFEPTLVTSAGALDRNASAKARLDALFGGPAAAGQQADEGDGAADAAPATPPALTKAEAAKAELERLFGARKRD